MLLIKDVLVNNKIQDILIDGNTIAKIGHISSAELQSHHNKLTVISGKNKLALPGLINTHTHIPMTILRGVGEDTSLHDWLNNHIWPKEAKLNEEIVYWATLAGCIEMLKTGTTTFNDMYFYSDALAQAVADCGIRAFIGFSMIDLLDESKVDEQVQSAQKYIEALKAMNNLRITPTVAVHAPYTCSKKLLQAAHDLAQEYDLLLHIHINETETEIKKIRQLTGMRPVEYLNSFKFFDNVKVIGAHGVYLSEKEIRILNKKQVSLALNPISNLKLGSGIANLPKLLKHDVNVTLATDGTASNNNLNLHEEIKLTAMLYKGIHKNPTLVPLEQINKIVYENAPNAMGIKAGKLKPGYLADIVLIDLNQVELTPQQNLKSHLIYSFNGYVSDTIVNGKLVFKNGKSTLIDEEQVVSKINDLYGKLL